LKTSYSFDDLDRLTSIEYRKASNNNLIRRFDYTYNSQNFIASQKVYDSSSSLIEWKEYEYDTMGRLTKAKTKDPITEQVTDTLEFQMDDIGNLTHEFDDDTTDSTYLYATNNMNELIKVKEDETPRSNPDVDVWGTVSVDTGATITLVKVNNLTASHSAGYFSIRVEGQSTAFVALYLLISMRRWGPPPITIVILFNNNTNNSSHNRIYKCSMSDSLFNSLEISIFISVYKRWSSRGRRYYPEDNVSRNGAAL